MRKTRLPYCFLFLSLLFVPAAFGEEMKVGYNHLSHLIEKKDGRDIPVGRLASYWEAMAREMGVQVKWVGPLPSNRILAYLKNGRIDAIYLASKSKERESFGLFPNQPIFSKRPVICFPAGKALGKMRGWGDLQALKKIGIVQGHRLSRTLAQEYPQLPLAEIKDPDPVRFSLTKLTTAV